MTKARVAVFISGFGSNLNVFLQRREIFDHLLVVSSNPEAYGLKRAEEAGVESLVLASPIDWQALDQRLEKENLDWIFLAGFMKILPAGFVSNWSKCLFNLHPSLLPKYKGLRAIERAFEAGDEVGVSIHRVVPEVDSGEVVLQKVAVHSSQLPTLNLQEVTEEVHRVEHQLVGQWIDKFC